MTRTGRAIATAAAVLLLCGSCRSGKKTYPGAPVILISIDTLRPDHLPDYGYRDVQTPHLSALRKDAILYQNAYSHVPLTLPSHAALLTGLLPYENGVRDNVGFRLSSSHPSLATLLKAHGYATGAAVSTYLLRRETGIAAGFDFYDDHLEPDAVERPGGQAEESLERWLDSPSASGAPVFAFLHIYEPHAPYAPPEPFRSRYAKQPYDGEIAASDAIVGRLLDFLKKKNLYDAAIVIVLSDHGEGLNDHGEEEHSVFLYREDIRVPLLVKLPRSRSAGRTIAAPVALTDVFPTVAALLGIDTGAPPRVDLIHAGEKKTDADRRIYSETLYPRLHLGWSDLSSLTDSRFQYIEAPRPEIYDLASDPGEKQDLAPSLPPAFRTMRIALQKINRPFVAPDASSEEELKKLGSLGYVTISGSGAQEKNLPDPKDRIGSLHYYKRLFELFFAKQYAEAASAAQQLLGREPRIMSAWMMLSESLDKAGRGDEAVRALTEGIAQAGQSGVGEEISSAYEQLAALLSRRGDRAGAERVLREALERHLATGRIRQELTKILTESGRAAEALVIQGPLSESHDAGALDALGVSLAEAGQLRQAREVLLRALEVEPGNEDVLSHLGTLSMREKNPAAARDWFEKALQSNPRLPGTLTSLGTVQVQLGDEPQALESWKKALELDPKQYEALFNLGVLTGRHGQLAQARLYLERFVSTAPRDGYPEETAEARRLLQGLKSKS
ncbi:MAG: sulfatase-like hydrolase/transferase [Acidobacteriota bacterium]